MRQKLPLAILLIALLTLSLTGPKTFAKLAWRAGNVRPALALVSDPKVRAVAHYALGEYEKSDAEFAEIGRGATYNRGLSLAMTGKYDLSAAYFKAVLFADQWDEDARHNLEVITPLTDPTIGEANGKGRIKAMIDAASPEPSTNKEQTRVGRPIDEKSVAASQDWLDSLLDAPGVFLKNRLAAEYEARKETGTIREEPSPW